MVDRWFKAERYWTAQLRKAYSRRSHPAYRKLARRAAAQLRRIRDDESWMRGVDPNAQHWPRLNAKPWND